MRWGVVSLAVLCWCCSSVRPSAILPPPSINTAEGNPQVSSADMFKCEICMVVLERKEAETTQGNCAGLEAYSTVCDEIVGATVRWARWINEWQIKQGCFKLTPVGLAVAKPCPAHAICSWIVDAHTRRPYCPADHTYHSTQGLRSAVADSAAQST